MVKYLANQQFKMNIFFKKMIEYLISRYRIGNVRKDLVYGIL